MAHIIDPYNFTNGEAADAEQVDARFAAVLGQVNGNLDETNIKDAAVTNVKLAAAAVRQAHIADGEVTKVKLAADVLNAFPQLVSAATRKVDFGRWDYTGNGTQERFFNIFHGLGVVPQVILMQPTRIAGAGFWRWVIADVAEGSVDSSKWGCWLQTRDAGVAMDSGAAASVYWLAIG